MYKTPGVYVEEISTLPPSVAEVATAIPAFIGTTQLGAAGVVEIDQVSTLLEFEQRFGKPKPTSFSATKAGVLKPLASNIPETPLWYAMNLYFKNGGGRCYVVSIDNYATTATQARYDAGLKALAAVDEPTLIVMPEATALAAGEYHTVAQAALAQCQTLRDRFTILDVKMSGGKPGAKPDAMADVTAFRDGIGTDALLYAAAYYPYLHTALSHVYDETLITIGDDAPKSKDAGGAATAATTMASLKTTDTTMYNSLKKQLADQRVDLPPSAAVAGVYARVDRDRGVWKAPANVSLSAVISPFTQITADQQETLNIDDTGGKSINAIRAFTGKGILVWGARTLAGNDNEWRYINVRRLFIMIEESARKASAFAVFEGNDAGTWLKVKGMLESFLYGLWERGALQGSKPESAYYVSVGLGKTMTAQDVLEGRMIVEIGIAAVRPAEFIVLRFSHKLPEA